MFYTIYLLYNTIQWRGQCTCSQERGHPVFEEDSVMISRRRCMTQLGPISKTGSRSMAAPSWSMAASWPWPPRRNKTSSTNPLCLTRRRVGTLKFLWNASIDTLSTPACIDSIGCIGCIGCIDCIGCIGCIGCIIYYQSVNWLPTPRARHDQADLPDLKLWWQQETQYCNRQTTITVVFNEPSHRDLPLGLPNMAGWIYS